MRNSSLFTFFLIAFSQFLKLYLVNNEILSSLIYETSHYHQLENFSYIESYAIQKTIKQFSDYKFDSITIETNLGHVYIIFIEETAYLHFDFENAVYGKLNYDLVYDSALAYDIIPEALFPSVDKTLH
ncbi:MAG TPA: hypothetical protein DIC19_03590 [Erysipelotrichaceae bacterium]|nr:hypothetical protein [Erysipelotrichaceae bacterium]